ncbi:hypothetical protein ACOMHN_026096 [Nucella lapillus]
MAIEQRVKDLVGAILCEVKPEDVDPSPVSLVQSSAFQSALRYTQQVLFVCQDNRITHQFLTCGSTCLKLMNSMTCSLVNMSSAQHANMVAFEKESEHFDAMFSCEDRESKVHYTLLCDFSQDCPAKSDESFCEHPSCTGFLCSNGQCMLPSQRCNQYSDCLDDSDEVGCPNVSSYLAWFKDGGRKEWIYVNLDGTGYFIQQVMPADQTCPDTHYPCQAESLYCLPVYTRCNGFADCVHGEDEQNCDAMLSAVEHCRL